MFRFFPSDLWIKECFVFPNWSLEVFSPPQPSRNSGVIPLSSSNWTFVKLNFSEREITLFPFLSLNGRNDSRLSRKLGEKRQRKTMQSAGRKSHYAGFLLHKCTFFFGVANDLLVEPLKQEEHLKFPTLQYFARALFASPSKLHCHWHCVFLSLPAFLSFGLTRLSCLLDVENSTRKLDRKAESLILEYQSFLIRTLRRPKDAFLMKNRNAHNHDIQLHSHTHTHSSWHCCHSRRARGARSLSQERVWACAGKLVTPLKSYECAQRVHNVSYMHWLCYILSIVFVRLVT